MVSLRYKIFHYFQGWHKFVNKLFFKQNSPTSTSGSYRIWYPLRIIPMLNFFYDLFFDDSPVSRESVKDLLDILGLVNALMLGAVLSLITSVNYGDMIEADNRYSIPGDNLSIYWNTWYENPPSVVLQNNVARSITFFFVCLLVVIFVYADSISKNPGDGTDESNEEKRANQELYFSWWGYAKYAVLVAMFLTGAGIIFAVLAGQQIFYIKYVDYYIAARGEISWSDFGCTVGFMSYTFRLTFGIAAIVAVGSCGAGTAAKYSQEDDDGLHLWYVEKLQSLKEANDEKKGMEDEAGYERLCKNFFYFLVACNAWVELHAHHELMLKLLGKDHKFFKDHSHDIDAMREEMQAVSIHDLSVAREKKIYLTKRIKRDFSKNPRGLKGETIVHDDEDDEVSEF